MAEWQTGKLRLLAKVSQLNPFFVVDEDEVGDATVAIDDDASFAEHQLMDWRGG